MALQMHPEIFEFDVQLKQTSALLAADTSEAPEEIIDDKPAQLPPNFDKALFEKLSAWRLQRARRDRAAPFIIAHNTLLEELASRPPATTQQLLGVKGFGVKKLEAYGEDIMKILDDHA
jgi:superfamily II DNA helicase RecQ